MYNEKRHKSNKICVFLVVAWGRSGLFSYHSRHHFFGSFWIWNRVFSRVRISCCPPASRMTWLLEIFITFLPNAKSPFIKFSPLMVTMCLPLISNIACSFRVCGSSLGAFSLEYIPDGSSKGFRREGLLSIAETLPGAMKASRNKYRKLNGPRRFKVVDLRKWFNQPVNHRSIIILLL